MRLIITLFILNLCLGISAGAQGFAGRKILTTALSVSGRRESGSTDNPLAPIRQTNRREFLLAPEVLYGKVSRKGLLFAYGLQFQYSRTRFFENELLTGSSKETRLYPTVMLQRFVPISDRVWFAPLGKLRVRYDRDHEASGKYNMYEAGVEVRPLSIAVNLKPQTMLLLMVGELSLGYLNTRSSFQSPLQTSTQRSSQFGITGTMQTFSAGMQFIL